VVIGYVDLLLDGEMGTLSTPQVQALDRIRGHGMQLLELIQETLDVNRLEAGLLPLDLDTFSVREFLDEVKESIPRTGRNRRRTDVAAGTDIHPVTLRPCQVEEVLRNLIHNALKFTERVA